MCGRFAVTVSPAMMASHFGLAGPLDFKLRFNIAPSQNVQVVRTVAGQRQLSLMRWGLIPHWAKDEKIGFKLINARSETVFEKAAFRTAAKHRRCLIPASGFFEWQRDGRGSQPFFIGRRDRNLFAMAGVWDVWQPPEGECLESCSILTVGSNELLRPIHDRMPVILAPESYDHWLRPDTDMTMLRHLLQPFSAQEMVAFPVSQAVNNPRFDRPDCITPRFET